MSRYLQYTVFLVGLASVCWVGTGYVGANPLALGVTGLIGAFYLTGALELRRYQQATEAFARTLTELREAPVQLGAWLEQLPASLRNAVRLRIEGERVGLPGPSLTPYLAGLLVLLGMLGTFLGMVVTLNGTGMALDGATDVQAVRASLSGPIKGLGLAFGTSIAGVAASAMLGLASALCRRDRLLAGQHLDTRIATTLRAFSQTHRHEESFKLLQQQALAMPALVDRLQAMTEAMLRRGQDLDERLASGQRAFHDHAQITYTTLAASVDRSLRESLAESARVAGAAIEPAVQATMAAIARETAALQAAVQAGVQQQLDGVSSRLETAATTMSDLWRGALGRHERTSEALCANLGVTLTHFGVTFEQQAATLLLGVDRAHSSLQADIGARTEAHARHTIDEVARLVQVAANAPRAAAEVIAELRERLSAGIARDNAMLEERGRLLEKLDTVLDSVHHASRDQHAAIDGLLTSSTEVLGQVGSRFSERIDAETAKMEGIAAQLVGSAAEVASLGEAFGFAVQIFGQSTEKLGVQLQRIEQALGKSTARSDEQLAYYVAQAREVIDLSIVSQKQIVEDLQHLARSREAVASGA